MRAAHPNAPHGEQRTLSHLRTHRWSSPLRAHPFFNRTTRKCIRHMDFRGIDVFAFCMHARRAKSSARPCGRSSTAVAKKFTLLKKSGEEGGRAPREVAKATSKHESAPD
jgi:hypothetical protein